MTEPARISDHSYLNQKISPQLKSTTQKTYEWRNKIASEILTRCKPMADLHNELAELRSKKGNKHRALPEPYWNRALELCDQLPVHVVAAVLPVSYATLRDRHQQILLKRAGLKGGKITIRRHSIDGSNTKVVKKMGIKPDRRWSIEEFVKNNPKIDEVLPGFAIQTPAPMPVSISRPSKALPKPVPVDLKPMKPRITKADEVLNDAISLIMDTPVAPPVAPDVMSAMKEAVSVPVQPKEDPKPLAAIRYAGIALDIFNKEHLKSIITDFFDVVTAPKVNDAAQ